MSDNKPIIILVCGPSACGKTSVVKKMNYLINKSNKIKKQSKVCLLDTSRPMRIGEVNGAEYNFKTKFEMIKNNNSYIYISRYNNWLYGLNENEIEVDKINLIVAGPDEIDNWQNLKNKYFIICFLLKDGVFRRIYRSVKRNGVEKEIFRRAASDALDFKHISNKISCFKYYHTLKNVQGVNNKTKEILKYLRNWGIF